LPQLIERLFGVSIGEYPYLVMEWIPAGNLWKLLMSESISMNLKIGIRMGKDIASGLMHLHSENILHCDLATR
jgi:serine/threonine protein kinase